MACQERKIGAPVVIAPDQTWSDDAGEMSVGRRRSSLRHKGAGSGRGRYQGIDDDGAIDGGEFADLRTAPPSASLDRHTEEIKGAEVHVVVLVTENVRLNEGVARCVV